MKRIKTLSIVAALVLAIGVLASCAQQGNDSNSSSSASQASQSGSISSSSSSAESGTGSQTSNASSDAQNTQAIPDEGSDEYYDYVYSLIDDAANDEDKKRELRKLDNFERIVSIDPDSNGFEASKDLENGSITDSLVHVEKDAKIYVDGKLASFKDLKVGDIVSFGGSTVLESYPAQYPDVKLVNAWTAKQDK